MEFFMSKSRGHMYTYCLCIFSSCQVCRDYYRVGCIRRNGESGAVVYRTNEHHECYQTNKYAYKNI